MKKFLLKFSVCLVIFFLTIFVSGKIYNNGNEIIVLISDGVLESFKGNENLKSFINSINSINPQTVCDKIIEECKKHEVEDDCTVLALRVFNIIE